jgi:hypothetical protein
MYGWLVPNHRGSGAHFFEGDGDRPKSLCGKYQIVEGNVSKIVGHGKKKWVAGWRYPEDGRRICQKCLAKGGESARRLANLKTKEG